MRNRLKPLTRVENPTHLMFFYHALDIMFLLLAERKEEIWIDMERKRRGRRKQAEVKRRGDAVSKNKEEHRQEKQTNNIMKRINIPHFLACPCYRRSHIVVCFVIWRALCVLLFFLCVAGAWCAVCNVWSGGDLFIVIVTCWSWGMWPSGTVRWCTDKIWRRINMERERDIARMKERTPQSSHEKEWHRMLDNIGMHRIIYQDWEREDEKID